MIDKEKLESHFAELKEQVKGFFTTKNHEESKQFFAKHRAQVLGEIQNMTDLLEEYPEYGAIGFLGKFQFDKCPEIKALTQTASIELLEEARSKKAIKLAESAHDAWEYLLAHQPKSLCVIVSLCVLASKDKTIVKSL